MSLCCMDYGPGAGCNDCSFDDDGVHTNLCPVCRAAVQEAIEKDMARFPIIMTEDDMAKHERNIAGFFDDYFTSYGKEPELLLGRGNLRKLLEKLGLRL